MKKQIISVVAAVTMAATMGITAFAEGNNPAVYVDGNKIEFEDQEAVIVDDITLVPVRGVFESMGADVRWNEDERKVTVVSDNGVDRAVLIIDDYIMNTFHFTSLFTPNKKEVELEVPPQIMNDRTMVPLRAISETIGADVEWDGENYAVIITTK